MKSYGVTIQMKPLKWYLHMVLFISDIVLTFGTICFQTFIKQNWKLLSRGLICFLLGVKVLR